MAADVSMSELSFGSKWCMCWYRSPPFRLEFSVPEFFCVCSWILFLECNEWNWTIGRERIFLVFSEYFIGDW